MVNYDKEELIQFIEENKQLILDLDFDELYSIAPKQYTIKTQELTQFLIDCGINPLDYVTNSCEDMFCSVTLPQKFENLDIPGKYSVKSLEPYTFQNCTGIKSISVHDIDKVSTACFQACKTLESVSIKNIRRISVDSFCACTELEHVYLENVKEIGSAAFSGCVKLKSIDLSTVQFVSLDVFGDCTSLKTVYAPKDLDLSEAGLPEDCEIIREEIV